MATGSDQHDIADEVAHGEDAHAGHDDDGHGDDHGHGPDDGHGHEAPSDAWVLVPLGVGLVIGLVILILLGLNSGAASIL